MLASYGASGNPFSFVLWDVVQQEPLAHTIREDNFNQGGLALNPNGQQLISVEVLPSSPDMGILTLWDITIEKWQEQACTIANRDLTQEEWNQFVKVDRHSKVCPSFAT